MILYCVKKVKHQFLEEVLSLRNTADKRIGKNQKIVYITYVH